MNMHVNGTNVVQKHCTYNNVHVHIRYNVRDGMVHVHCRI